MLRGLDRVQLFYDDEDSEHFLERLAHYQAACGFVVYAYCLMGNHIHLLLKESSTGLSQDIKRLATSYAHWFNKKYERSGYLFQNRFKSEAIQSDEYLLEALRYVLNNPVKAGLPITHWSSYSDYVGEEQTASSLTETSFVLEMFSSDKKKAKELLEEFLHSKTADERKYLDVATGRLRDAEAISLICKTAQVKSCVDLATQEKEERDYVLAQLKEKGLTIRQIARLTGINRGIVQKARKPEC